jgi:release factor glutamine methyltransferase
MSDQDRWTIGRLLKWTTDYLRGGGSTSPRLDAEILLSEARGCPRIELYTAFDDEPGDTVRNRFRELVKRRASGEPVAYLVGHREFYSLSFHVTPEVLIPRPETEFVVLTALDAIKEFGSRERRVSVADVGTGSGAIAVSIAKHAPDCQVTAIDISPAALAVARGNAERHGVADRIEFLAGDLFAPVPDDRQFDIIASNPPYVAESELASLSRDVRDYEPRSALVGGPDGTDVIRRLLKAAPQRLHPGGWLITEIGPQVVERIRNCIDSDPQWCHVSVIKDLAGLPRVIRAGRAGTT